MSIAIKVENLSKAYQLGEIGTGTLSRDIERWWAKLNGKGDPYLKLGEVNDRTVVSQSNIVWSLKDINFEIQQGDAVGIIGRNGAGKSTLLKLLSRVTSPTTGLIKARGRIASLLEVGTGFHPELTGRENIYLNGAILGMRKREISRKFDEIVNFSGVEKYVDTPVKRYSSGMYVRLAFAVAAYLDSEILIVDEVLAVGDAEFQQKCLGKMSQVSKGEGRTVLFVSHQMGSIQSLCNNCILLSNGKIMIQDKTLNVINKYLLQDSSREIIYTNEKNCISSIFMIDDQDFPKNSFSTGEDISMKIAFNKESLKNMVNTEIGIAILDNHKNKIFTVKTILTKTFHNNVICHIPKHTLTPGNYSIDIALFKGKISSIEYLHDILPFNVIDGGTDFSTFEGADYGKVFVNAKWTL